MDGVDTLGVDVDVVGGREVGSDAASDGSLVKGGIVDKDSVLHHNGFEGSVHLLLKLEHVRVQRNVLEDIVPERNWLAWPSTCWASINSRSLVARAVHKVGIEFQLDFQWDQTERNQFLVLHHHSNQTRV